MTRREAISDVKTVLKKINADADLFNKEIWIKLSKHLEWLIERDSNTFKLGRKHSIFQSYNCAEVIEVPKIDSCCNIVTNCTIMRTKDKLPPIYEDINGIIYKSVTSVDGSTILEYSSQNSYKAKKNNPWGRNSDKYWFFENGYIYGDLPASIKINALFKEDISKYNNCGKSPETECISELDRSFIIPNTLIAQAIDFVIKELMPSLGMPTQEKIDKNENR